jgi:hypothetical protein
VYCGVLAAGGVAGAAGAGKRLLAKHHPLKAKLTRHTITQDRDDGKKKVKRPSRTNELHETRYCLVSAPLASSLTTQRGV